MKRAFQVILISMIAQYSSSNALEGTWQEDKEKSIQWNAKHTKVGAEKLEKLAAIMGHMYITHKDGISCQFFEPYTLTYNGVSKEVPRFPPETSEYEIVEKNEFGYVIKSIYENGTEAIAMLIYEGKDSHYVVRLNTEDFGLPGARIYFKKMDTIKWDADCVK